MRFEFNTTVLDGVVTRFMDPDPTWSIYHKLYLKLNMIEKFVLYYKFENKSASENKVRV